MVGDTDGRSWMKSRRRIPPEVVYSRSSFDTAIPPDVPTAEGVVRSLLPRFWKLRLREVREQGRWRASSRGLLSGMDSIASSPGRALVGLAEGLALLQMPKLFAAAGWSVLRREVDEVELLVVASPTGDRWAVTIGDPMDDGMHRVTRGMIEDVELPMRFAMIPPSATLTHRELIDALTTCESTSAAPEEGGL